MMSQTPQPMETYAPELSFNVLNAVLREEFGDDRSENPGTLNTVQVTRLSMEVKLEDHPIAGVTFSSGERLKELHGSASIRPQSVEVAGAHEAVGSIEFAGPRKEAPASYFLRLSLPEKQFENILAVARLGRMPTQLDVRVAGLDLRSEYELTWDNRSASKLQVTFVRLTTILTAGEYPDGEKDRFFARVEIPPFHSPTRADFSRMTGESKSLGDGLLRRLDYLAWLIIAVGAAGITTVLLTR